MLREAFAQRASVYKVQSAGYKDEEREAIRAAGYTITRCPTEVTLQPTYENNGNRFYVFIMVLSLDCHLG